MPDIALRFHKDMLVVSSPVAAALERLGINPERDADFTLLFEPEAYEEVYRMEAAAGPQCMAAPTAYLTPARLAAASLEASAEDLARAALELLRPLHVQHTLVELVPCGLPLDPSSAASLKETRGQYRRFAKLFANQAIDGYLLSGFRSSADMRCALEALREEDGHPILASVAVDAQGTLAGAGAHSGTFEEACELMAAGADAIGFETPAGVEAACALVGRARAIAAKPVLVGLAVGERTAHQQGPTEENPYYCADMMVGVADALCAAGAQFLRAVGNATPAYTGALVAASWGRDARGPKDAGE